MITIIRNSKRPRDNIKILLNRRSVQSYEQLIKDISEAFGPRWKNSKVKRLFTLKGQEVLSVSDFFREDDVFLALGAGEMLTYGDVQDILEETYPDNPYAQNMVKDWERQKRRQRIFVLKKNLKDDGKRDSGFGSDSSKDDGNDVLYEAKPSSRVIDAEAQDQEKPKAAETRQDKARRRMLRQREAEHQAAEEERRKKGLIPLKPLDESSRQNEDRYKSKRRKEPSSQSQERDSAKVIVVVKNSDTKVRVNTPKIEEKENETLQPNNEKEEQQTSAETIDSIQEESENSKNNTNEFQSSKEDTDKKGIVTEPEDEESKKKTAELEENLNEEIPEHESEKSNTVINEKSSKPEASKSEDAENSTVNQEGNVEEVKEEKKEDAIEEIQEKKNDREEEELVKSARPKTPSSKGRALTIKEKSPLKDNGEKKKNKNKMIIHKTKLERQISNVEHVLHKYEPGKTLGDGNFAVVKQCKLKNTKSEYAMKIIDKAKLKGKENMVENEIAIMKICNHANIVKLIEEFETNKEIYLIMELVKVMIYIVFFL